MAVNREHGVSNPFNHIDLRVADMEAALPFYRKLLPFLGFAAYGRHREPGGKCWEVFAVQDSCPTTFFSITEEKDHQANRNCIAFYVGDRETVDQAAALVREAGGRNIEGPCWCPEYSSDYYAVFFEDPSGNRLEVVNWPQ